MAGFLFDEIVFGPIHSRRMGSSLGVNLLPLKRKYCTFNCIYCECGWTINDNDANMGIPPLSLISSALEEKLIAQTNSKQLPDAITFAGNGEPTLHPEFAQVIDETIRLRDLYAPKSLITVLSNGTMLHHEKIFNALLKVDQNIQKLDAGTSQTIQRINQPYAHYNLDNLVENLIRFNGKVIIQTLFLRGTWKDYPIDNTTKEELEKWLEHLKRIKPIYVMLYPIDRATPASGLEKIGPDELGIIAQQVQQAGIDTRVYA